MIAARLSNMRRTDTLKQNRSDGSIDPSEISLEQAAKLLNVGRAIIAAKLVNMRRRENRLETFRKFAES
jgi:hypothetical protein